jgi:hypothetical protein
VLLCHPVILNILIMLYLLTIIVAPIINTHLRHLEVIIIPMVELEFLVEKIVRQD